MRRLIHIYQMYIVHPPHHKKIWTNCFFWSKLNTRYFKQHSRHPYIGLKTIVQPPTPPWIIFSLSRDMPIFTPHQQSWALNHATVKASCGTCPCWAINSCRLGPKFKWRSGKTFTAEDDRSNLVDDGYCLFTKIVLGAYLWWSVNALLTLVGQRIILGTIG
jgi:hypothetical protein